jgi:RHS repeat-associated protein
MTVTVPSWGRTLRHDSANRLVAVEDGARRTSFRYDAFGALDGVCVSEAGEAPVCTAVLLDTSGSLPVVIGTVRTARDAVLYAHGVSGVAAQTALSNGVPSDVYYGISDERRSLRALVKAGPVAGAAEVVHRKAYDAYGVLRATEGPFGSAIGFAGEWTTPEGWTWNRARFVIPELGRLDRRDTFAGYAAVTPSLNRYAYANNDPVNKVDPTGMAATYGADEMLLQAGIGAGDTFVNSFLNMPASTWNLLSWGLSGVNRALGQESVYAPTPNWVGHARGALGTDIAGLEETGGYKAGAIGMTVAMAVRDLYKLGRSLGSIWRVAQDGGQSLRNAMRARPSGSSGAAPGGAVLDRTWTKNNKLDREKLRELSRRLNELDEGIDLTVDIDTRPVITQGPNCSIYGNCDGIAARARAILSRYSADEVLSRKVAPQMPFTFPDPIPPVRFQGTAAQFGQHAKPGTLGIIGTGNFKHAGGEFAGHTALVLQTKQGPVVLDMQRGAQLYDLSAFPDALVTW